MKLTKAEESVMQLLWLTGPSTVSDLLHQLPEEDKVPHSTLSSVVRILEKKGFVGHKAYGKTYEYFPIVKKEDYAGSTLTDILAKYFNGSASNLVSHLVQKEKLSVEELEALMNKLDD